MTQNAAGSEAKFQRVKRWIVPVAIALAISAIVFVAQGIIRARSMGFLRMPSYDSVAPTIPELNRPAVLVFSKTNSFIHKEAIPAAEAMFRKLGEQHGWSIYVTDNGAVHNQNDLARFDTLVWNNVTGNVLTESQQKALMDYLQSGGGWIGIHGAGDSSSDWDWYKQSLVGAEFIGHPMDPQFQQATIHVEGPDEIVGHLPAEWVRTDEWYSFAESPRKKGVRILGTLDESTYNPMFFSKDVRMGEDHPIIWKHCIGAGRAFYSALGHTAESYSETEHVQLLVNAVAWTAGLEGEPCRLPPE